MRRLPALLACLAVAAPGLAAPTTAPADADAVMAAVRTTLAAAVQGDRAATLAGFDRPELPTTAKVVDRLVEAMHAGNVTATPVRADTDGGDVALVTLEMRQPGKPLDVEPMEAFRTPAGWTITVYRTKSTATPDQQARLRTRLIAWRNAHRPPTTGPTTRVAS